MSWHSIPSTNYNVLTDEEIEENQKAMITTLSLWGWTLEAICGLMSNIYSESLMNAGAWGNTPDIKTCEQYQLPDGQKFATAGFIQWQDPSGNGVQPLLKRAYDKGKTGYEWASPLFQLQWINENGGGKWQGPVIGVSWSEYKSLKGGTAQAEQCGRLICEFLEGLNNPATIESRGRFAGSLYMMYEHEPKPLTLLQLVLLFIKKKRRL